MRTEKEIRQRIEKHKAPAVLLLQNESGECIPVEFHSCHAAWCFAASIGIEEPTIMVNKDYMVKNGINGRN